tara:strand:+ start:2344 stop:4194 length:1851 start_codon:yes stop_codon:yes gene_type:complete
MAEDMNQLASALILRSRLAFLPVLALLSFLSPSPTWARGNFGNWTVDGLTKTQVEVYSAFEGLPDRGYLPVTVKIRNGFESERRWSISFDAKPQYSYGDGITSKSSFSITTPGQSETEHELMVPIPSSLDRSPNTEVIMRLSSRGVGPRSGSIEGFHHRDWPSIAFSDELDGRDNLDQLSTHLRNVAKKISSNEAAATLFEAEALSADWRAYTGFDAIMLTDTEWMALEPSVRREILAWNRLGGHLFLYTTAANANAASFGINDIGPKSNRSLGKIRINQWDGDRINLKETANQLIQAPVLTTQLDQNFVSKWGLQKTFGFRNFNPIAVFLILIAFAIAVGPVNLFVLAKPGMRHRLFITTPIISLAASFLLILLIVFQDGFGGSGIRTALMLLNSEPDERRAYVIQEQISRTGVLLNRSFEMDEPTFITPAVMNTSRWTHFDDSSGLGATFRYVGNDLGGDWFQSRSEQAHYAQTIRPTRARIERLDPDAEGTPRFFSSIDFGLREFFYIAEDGKVWKAKDAVSAGQEIELAESDQEALTAFWNSAREDFTKTLKKKIGELVELERDTFFAVATKPRDHLIPTLQSIRWRTGTDGDRLLLVGSPIEREPKNAEGQ